MREISLSTPDNTYVLSDAEIAVIQALCFYAPDGMTKSANNVRDKMLKKLNYHKAVGSYKVWSD